LRAIPNLCISNIEHFDAERIGITLDETGDLASVANGSHDPVAVLKQLLCHLATEAGERLLRTVGPRLDEVDAELAALSELRDKPAGTIHITAGEHAAESILCPAAARLLPQYPDIKVEIVVDYGLTNIVVERTTPAFVSASKWRKA
jgi:hypothetical protein